MLGDVVAVYVDIVTIGVEVVIEYERRIHEGAWVNKTAPFLDFHFLNVEDKTSVENLESDRALSSKQNDLVVRYLVSQTHVGRNPLGLVDLRVVNLLPHIAGYVVDFDGVNNTLLINASTKRKDVVVLERAQRHARPWDTHFVNLLPLVFLRIVYFAPPIDLVVHKSSHHVNEALNRAHRVVRVRVVHLSHWLKNAKNFVVAMAALQVDVGLLDEATDQVDGAGLSGNASGVKWHFMLHLDRLLFELSSLDPVDLRTALVPLERVQTLWQVGAEAALDVVVNSEIAVDKVIEVVNDFICVLIEQPLELRHFLIIIEVLLILRIQLVKYLIVVLKCLNQFFGTFLLCKIGRLLELAVLLDKSLIELRQLRLHVVLDVFLLVADYLENFVFEFCLALFD